MARIPRPCLGPIGGPYCGQATTNVGGRCDIHVIKPLSACRRGYDRRWRNLRTEAIRRHVAQFGWVCPGYVVVAHPVVEGGLTADHRIPLVAGGTSTIDNVQVLCASCNGRKGGKTKPPRRYVNP